MAKVLIVEVGYNPLYETSNRGEWFQLYNQSEQKQDLSGWTVRDSGAGYGVYQFDSGVFLDPYESIVVANLSTGPLSDPVADQRPGFFEEYGRNPDFEMAGIQCIENGNKNHCLQLHNSQGDSLALQNNLGVLEDSVQWYSGSGSPQSGNGESICRIAQGSAFLDTDSDSDWLSDCSPTPLSLPFTPPVISSSHQIQVSTTEEAQEDVSSNEHIVVAKKSSSSGGSNPLVVQRLRESDSLFGDIPSGASLLVLQPANSLEKTDGLQDLGGPALEETEGLVYGFSNTPLYNAEKSSMSLLRLPFSKYWKESLRNKDRLKNLLTQ